MNLTYLWPLDKVKVIKTWSELVDPKQVKNNAKSQKPSINSDRQKAKVKTIAIQDNKSIISLEYVQK